MWKWKCESESVSVKVWKWKCESVSVKVKVWKCEGVHLVFFGIFFCTLFDRHILHLILITTCDQRVRHLKKENINFSMSVSAAEIVLHFHVFTLHIKKCFCNLATYSTKHFYWISINSAALLLQILEKLVQVELKEVDACCKINVML